MIKLTLRIDGDQRTFYARTITARTSIEAYKLKERWDKVQGESTEELIEDQLAFVTNLFDGEFTRDEFLDGYEDNYFIGMALLIDCVIGAIDAKFAEFPPTAATVTAP